MPRRVGFSGLLVAAMVSATLMNATLGILATFLIDDLQITRTQVGALIGVGIVLAAVLSPPMGRMTDALGGRRSLFVVFGGGVVAYLGVAASPVYWVMYIPIIAAAIGQAAANPATNKIIAEQVDPGRRSVITGIKQSGVQAGIFVAGITVPSIALSFGWRWALAIVAVVPAVGMLVALPLVPADRDGAKITTMPRGGPLPPAIGFLAVYGALLGFGGAYTFLVPLYAEEALGMSARLGGAAAGVIGLASVGGRILWARIAERGNRYYPVLAIVAALSVMGALAFLAAEPWGTWLMWVGVALTGLSSSSWNSVGMLAVMAESGTTQAGRGSGIVMFGFLVGLGSSPPALAWTVDTTGGYRSVWLISVAALVAGLAIALWWLRRAGRAR